MKESQNSNNQVRLLKFQINKQDYYLDRGF